MHLRRLPSGRWRVIVKHRGQQRTATADTQADATALGARMILDLGGTPTVNTVTVRELVHSTLAERGPKWSPTTLADMALVAEKVPKSFANRPLAAVTPAVVEGMWRQLERDGLSAHRQRRMHRLLSISWQRALLYGWAGTNPFSIARPTPPAPRDMQVPTDAQVRSLLATPGTIGLFIRVAATTGARRGELCALQWPDVDLERAQLLIRRSIVLVARVITERPTKTGTKGQRVVTLDEPTVARLAAHKTAQDHLAEASGLPAVWVFSDTAGATPWLPDSTTRSFIRARRRAHVPDTVRLHDLRHYVATSMLQDGEAPLDVAAQLGHASTSTTLGTYAHYVPGRNRKAIDRLAARLDN